MNLTPTQEITLELVLNGQIGMSQAIRNARLNGEHDFADYLRTF